MPSEPATAPTTVAFAQKQKPFSEMTAIELSDHIFAKDKKHRSEMKHLRALLRIVRDRERQ